MESSKSWLFYGRAATGKTTLACTFPKPLLLVDVHDEGTDSVSDVKDVHVFQPQTWDDLEDLYWHLYSNPKGYQTVVIDHITQVQNLLITEIAGGKAEKKGKVAGDWGTMTKQDWGEVSGKLKKWITDLRSLPIEVVFLAHERIFNLDEDDPVVDEGDIAPEVGPRLSPATASHLCGSVSIIGQTFIRQAEETKLVKGKKVRRSFTEYCVRLGPHAYYVTKIRKPRSIEVPSFLPDPDYDGILDIIQGE